MQGVGWRIPLLAGSAVRLAYGIGALAAPSWMDGRLAPTSHGLADPRMNLRGFGASHMAIAATTLRARRDLTHVRTVLLLNATNDALDGIAAALEWRSRGGADRIVAGGLILPLMGLANWLGAWRALERDQSAR